MFVTIRGIANIPSSNDSASYNVESPTLSAVVIKNVSEKRAGKTTGIKLIRTMEIVKVKAIQETLVNFLSSVLLI